MKLTLFVLVAWLVTAPAFAQKHKGSNFGGIPVALLDQMIGEVTGTVIPGMTPADTTKVLVALVHEEHAAANPGPDETGFMDAMLAFEELRTANENLKENSNPANTPTLVDVLAKKIDALGKLWKVGPVAPGFYSPEPVP
jgi:hypothetical protein